MKPITAKKLQEAAKRGREGARKQDAFEKMNFELGLDIQQELYFNPPTAPPLAIAYTEGYHHHRHGVLVVTEQKTTLSKNPAPQATHGRE